MKLRSDRFAAAILAAFLALPLCAAEDPVCPAIDPSAATARLRGDFRVFRDPETGKLRQPTREEAAELAKLEAEAAPEAERVFVVVEHPDGMKSVDLQGAFSQSVVVTRNADGSLTFRCVPEQLAAVPAAPVQPAHSTAEEN